MRALLLAALAFVVFGCTGGSGSATDTKENPPETKAPAAVTKQLKVALLTPGPVNDNGWSAMAYSGLKEIEGALHAEVNNQETKEAQIKDAFRSYAQKGYNLIFGHGFEYYKPATEVAKDFPNTVFVSSSGAGEAPANVGSFRFCLEEGFYICGYMAGMMTKTGSVAMIGGDDVPSIRSTFEAFKAGASAAKPDIKVIETFTGDGQDVAKAKQATEAAIAQGADFVIHQANAAAKGVFDACKEKKIYAFGANLDQNSDPSGVVIASAVINAKPAFLTLATKVQDGEFKGGVTLMQMKDNAIDFIVNPALMAQVPDEVKAKLAGLKDQIKTDTIKVPRKEF